ncbi:MAG: hypothetical protein FJY88_11420 [Candidatus Eisenbacteria bacterium]|nr:hypothetical protein [Candidatus Eisenbacteria bacterium]
MWRALVGGGPGGDRVRIDLLLHALCLFKTRSQASKACAEGRVWLNDQQARSSRTVSVGDRIRWRDSLGRMEEEVQILEIPTRQVSRAASRDMIRPIAKRTLDDPWVSE